MKIKFVQLESDVFLMGIEEWFEWTFFFPPMRNDSTDFVQYHPPPDAVPMLVA